ncbi:MAG: caspase family protein [Bacteroidales bacterium]|nr:caspase family protein [Bacteroidales bacterium]
MKFKSSFLAIPLIAVTPLFLASCGNSAQIDNGAALVDTDYDTDTSKSTLSAQAFYEVHFTDPSDGEDYLGLMIYYNEENCKLRLITDEQLQNNEVSESNYYNMMADKESKDDVGIMYYQPENEGFPWFMWAWEADDASDISEKPFFSFDVEQNDAWAEVDYFNEISLADMDEEYVSQFYGPGEPEFKMLTEGSALINSQEGGAQGYGESQWSSNEPDDTQAGNTEAPARENTLYTGDTEPTTTVAKTDATLHLIVVANTIVSDIGQSCKTDMDNVRSEFNGIASVLGMKYNELLVSGDNYGKSYLAETIKNFKPEANDVVVFVYTGHGFRFDDQKDYYPNMCLTRSSYDDISKNYVAMSDVYSELTQKGARLTIVLSDCCNSKVGMDRPTLATNSLFSRANNNFDIDKMQKLFLKSSGSILSTASSPGEYSWCGVNGGFFLLSVIESMRNQFNALSTNDPSWNTLIKDAIRSAYDKSNSSQSHEAQNGLKYVKVKSLN